MANAALHCVPYIQSTAVKGVRLYCTYERKKDESEGRTDTTSKHIYLYKDKLVLSTNTSFHCLSLFNYAPETFFIGVVFWFSRLRRMKAAPPAELEGGKRRRLARCRKVVQSMSRKY